MSGANGQTPETPLSAWLERLSEALDEAGEVTIPRVVAIEALALVEASASLFEHLLPFGDFDVFLRERLFGLWVDELTEEWDTVSARAKELEAEMLSPDFFGRRVQVLERYAGMVRSRAAADAGG